MAPSTPTSTSGIDDSDLLFKKITPLKGSDDYPVLSSKMKDLLFQLNLDDHIDATKVNANKSTKQDWDKYDQSALINICSQVSDNAYIRAMSNTDALLAWDKLKEIYEAQGTLANLYQRQKLDNICMTEGEPLETHMQIMQRISDDKNRWDEEEWITLLIGSLPPSWKPVIQTLPIDYEKGVTTASTTANKNKMVQNVTQRLFAKESRLKGEIAPKGESSMFNQSQSRFPKSNSDQKPGKCHNCGKWGHWANEC
ncbi:unnamed protein product [Rhizoctonia solani]|uniref:CCHC-type domain-containing protein n=1 Tax=Rhizoctonia solani TaxID=456999 RepID=A0A8H3BPI3_9AGAM|nr:unnamed protein product [Rhizoctonia solani]